MAACRADLVLARGFNKGRRHLQPIKRIINYALFTWRVGMHILGPLSDKQELSPGSDIVHTELPLAACRADLVSALCFN